MPSGSVGPAAKPGKRCLDLRSQEMHGGKARLAFDQARPTCDCRVRNRPGFGVVDVMHVFAGLALDQASVRLCALHCWRLIHYRQ